MRRIVVRLVVRGRVQGVGFRWWTVCEARRLGLDGWVRNLADGSVEILAIGASDDVARLAEACRRGPAAAAVDAVEQNLTSDDGSIGFEERPSGHGPP